MNKIYKIVLCCDLHNFSFIANKIPDNSYKFLQDYYESIGNIITKKGGEVIKYIGDCILSTLQKDSELTAINCAIKMRLCYIEMIKKYNIKTETELEVGIGSGEIIYGIFGHESLRSKEIFGNIVNLVSRISCHRGIAITEGVYMKVKNDIALKFLKELKIKGDDKSHNIYEVTNNLVI